MAAAYAAKRQPAVRLEERSSRNDAKVAAMGELASSIAHEPGVSALEDRNSRCTQLF